MILTARDEPTIIDEKDLKEIDKLFSKGIRTKLRSKVGIRALPFFEFYLDLKRIHLGLPVDGDIHRDYMRRVNRLIRSVQLPPSVVNQLAESKKEMMTLLMRLRVGQNPMLWRRINEHFVPLFLEVAKSVGVYLDAQQRGSERWVVRFRPMNKKQVYLEELRLRDPETAALLEEYGKSLEQIDSKIEKTIKDATGSDPIKRFIMGRPVQIGKDSQTGEEFVYDRDGDVLPVEDYITKRKDQEEARKRLEKVKTRSDVNVEELRYVDPEVLTGETNWVALTDDKAKSSPMTRLFPVKDYLDESLNPPTRIKIVASGRYAGIALDDLVNQEGRLIEGTQYKLVPKGRGTGVRIPVKIDPAEREPYCTVATVQEQYDEETFVDTQKLYVKIPGGHQFKELRQAAKVIAGNVPPLTGSIPSIQYQSIKGTRAVGLYFEPKDFETVRNMLQSMSFSKAAVDFLEGHFRDLINANEIAAEENLKNYSLDAIGGFKPQFDLLAKQKEAIAWTELNGNRGVVALDTGVGKCCRFDTLVETTQGTLTIDSFKPKDAQVGGTYLLEDVSVFVNGKTLPVKSFYYNGVKPTKRIVTGRGYEIEGTLNHPILIAGTSGEVTWKKLNEVEEGDRVCIHRRGFFPSEEPNLTQIQASNPNVTFPKTLNKEFARLLAYIVGEGWTMRDNHINISQHKNKNPVVYNDILSLIRTLFNIKPYASKETINISYRDVCKFIYQYIDKGLSKDKKIPDIIFRGTRDSVRDFLRAFVDAEGSTNSKTAHIEISSASETLIRQLQILLLKFGITSSRAPKKAKGYDHTYWRLSITGRDAINYAVEIGFISPRKIKASKSNPSVRNSNLDVVPHLKELAFEVRSDFLEVFGSVSKTRKALGNSIVNSCYNVYGQNRQLTYDMIVKLMGVYEELDLTQKPAYTILSQINDSRYFYDYIETIEDRESEVMDLEVDDPSHCFVGNGFINHNTVTAIATMQKLIRDGFADEDASYKDKLGNEVKTNGRFLYICPRDLKGNIGAEMKKFMESSKTSSMSKLASVPLRQQVDVLSFTEFARAAKKNAIPGPLKRNDYWRDKDEWNPQQYIGLFFDEAHQMTSGEMDAAREMYHPRKVILTASPMEDDPMQAWDLYAITNNKTLDASTMEGKKNRIERRRFRDRYCERVGRQIVGVKQNPLLMRELMIWTKRNIFSVKKTEVKEFALPELKKDVVSVEMDPEVEMMYREVTKVFSKLLKGMASRVKERGGSDMLPEARDPELEVLFTRSFAPVINLMNGLGKYPQKALLDMAYMMENDKTPKGRGIPKFMKKVLASWGKKYSPQDLREMAMRASNPALNVCAQKVEDRLRESDGSGRSLIFSDDAEMCENTAINISKKVPGRFVLGLKDEIRIYKNGKEMDEIKVPVNLDTIEKIVGSREKAQDYYRKVGGWVVFKAPFKKRIYRLYPALPEHKLYNPKSTAGEWQSFVLKNLISPDEKYKGLILYGPSYQVGQNLQAFDQVIHMDRDSWSDQNMEQREGRSWRQGQKYPVDVVYIDAKYSEAPGGQTRKDVDVTIDGLQGAVELIQSEMFASVIQAAQRLGQDDGRGLGAEWQEILRSDASNARLQDKIVELMASPYI